MASRKSRLFSGAVAGYSLVELLIAMFVFTLITVFAYRSVDLLMGATDDLKVESVALIEVQKVWQLWQRDFQASVAHGKLPLTQEAEFAGGAEDAVMLVDFGRVKYLLEKGVLYRYSQSEGVGQSLKLVSANAVSMAFDDGLFATEGLLVGRLRLDHVELGRFERFFVASSHGRVDDAAFDFAEAGESGDVSTASEPSEATLIDEAVF